MVKARALTGLGFALFVTTAAGAAGLDISSMAPQGSLKERGQQRIQIVFSSPVVPLGEAQTLRQPPPWLSVTPPILARWRWAGTSELIGEPLAPLPQATAYEVRVAASLTAVDGSTLGREVVFTFTTPLPVATMTKDTTAAADAFPVVLTFNQPIDPGSLASRLQVRIAPNPLDALDAELAAAQSRRLQREDPGARAAWERFVELARGAQAATPEVTIEPDPDHPHEVFLVKPVGCWPPAAAVEVTVAPGVRGLEGPLASDRALTSTFHSPWPFGPVRFAGRAAESGGLEPESVQLVFSADVTWRDICAHLTYREAGETSWRTVQPFAEEWAWEWQETELGLGPLGLAGGARYEVCLDADTVDAEGRRLGFPWCGAFTTSHHSPTFYLVEGDGVVEWDGPHLLPLRVRNVTSYRFEQRRVAEDELVPLLLAREERDAEPLAEARSVPVALAADRSAVLPIDLDPTLSGRPGIVLTRVQVEKTVPGSEYDEGESRWLRQPRSSVTQVTSLGLTVKGSRYEGILIWVTDLKDPRPAAGVAVTVRSKENAVLWSGETDAAGLARTPADVSLEQAYVVTARRGEDLAYARTTWWEGHRGWEFGIPVDYHALAPLLGHVWTDRGVVRPGESLHVKAVVRRRGEHGLTLPAAGPFTFVVRNPSGDDAVIVRTTYDPESGADALIKLPETTPLGTYEVVVGDAYDEDTRAFSGEDIWGVACSFRVAEFRRPKFRVAVTSKGEYLVAGDPLLAEAEGRLLAGGPMGGAEARWTVRARRASWRPAGERWAKFETLPTAFFDEEMDASAVVAGSRAALDESGRLVVSVPRVEAFKAWPARLEVEVDVTDVDRQTSAANAQLTVLPGEFSLAVERPPFFIRAADGAKTRVAALAADGTPRPGVSVNVALVRRHFESIRRREVSGRYVFESNPVTEELASKQVTTGTEPVAVEFELAAGGEFAFVVSAADARGNRVEASTSFYVFGEGFAAWRFDRENRIELVPERDRYLPGETARILVKSPWERATALLTVERAGVLEQRVEELVGTMPTIEVPVKAEHAPNVFVSVVLLRGRIDAPPDPELIDPGRPAYRVGYCELTVPPQGKRLKVSLATAKPQYRPGQQAEATVTVTAGSGEARVARVTLWAVDAGVLSLTGYRTPDLMETFFARRGLGVTTAESRSRLVGRRSYGSKGDKPGGGGGMETAGEQVRRDFRALAFWEGTVVTDANGRATVRFPLPDSLTTYRLMAVAAAGTDEFGSAEKEFVVTKPIGLEPALPRFLRPTDMARAGVVVRNRTKTEQEIDVTLTVAAGSPIELRGTASRVARVPAGGSQEVGFGLVATKPGVATLTFTARSAGPVPETDAMEVPLPVLAVQPAETVATFFATTGEAREAVAVPRDVFPSTGGLTVRLAPTSLVEAGAGVRFLERYPYACSEQIASRVLGITAALRLGAGFAPAAIDGEPPGDWLAGAVATLVDRQRSDGGFAFWPGGRSYEELSSFVAWALVEARAAGVEVDPDVLDAAAEYLSRRLREERRRWGASHDWTARVLLSFALQRLGRAEPAYFQALFDARKGEGNVWGRALLVTAMLAANRSDPRAGTLLQELRNSLAVEARTARLEESAPEWGWWVFWSEPRGSAMTLMALLAADPADPLTERLARGLLDHVARDRFRTTHDTAWMLQALAAYREKHERGLARGTAEVSLAGDRILDGRFSGAKLEVLETTVGMDSLQKQATAAADPLPLAVRFAGDGMLHGEARLSYAPRQGDRQALNQGLGIGRRFLDSAGREVRRVSAGAEVTLEVVVDCPAIRRFVAVDVPIPAGIEAIDPSLATSAEPAEETDEDAEDGGWQPGFDRVELRDDRVVLFATELPPGRHTHTVRCRATTQGTFVVAPGKAEEMYAPEVFGTVPVEAFEVTPGRR